MNRDLVQKEKDNCEKVILQLKDQIEKARVAIQTQQQNMARFAQELLKKEGELGILKKVVSNAYDKEAE